MAELGYDQVLDYFVQQGELNPQREDIARQRALANQLRAGAKMPQMRGGRGFTPASNPLEFLASGLATGLGAQRDAQADAAQQELGATQRSLLAQLRGQVAPPQPPTGAEIPHPAGMAPPGPPMAGPQAGPGGAIGPAGPNPLPPQTNVATAQPAPAPGTSGPSGPAMSLEEQRAQAVARQQAALAPPDVGPLKDLGKQRQASGAHYLMLALAAQNAGKDYAPFSEHFMKQAAEAQAPMKTAGGFVTGGDFVADPEVQAMRKIQAADNALAQIDRRIDAARSAAERGALNEQRLQIQQAGLDLRRELGQAQLELGRGNLDLRREIADTKAQAGAAGKVLPSKTVQDLNESEARAGGIARLASEFRPEYAGAKGTAAKIAGNVGGMVGVDTKSAEWWRNYAKEAELTERHALFGASLTAGEQAAWRGADISPTMASSAIERNLKRRAELVATAHRRAVERFRKSGYNAEAFQVDESLAPPRGGGASGDWGAGGGAPARVTSDADYNALPSGTVFTDPNGKVRRKP